jgi:hypothetical protein
VEADTGAMPTQAFGDDDANDSGTVAVDDVCLGGSRRLVRKGWRATCFDVCVETWERKETRPGRQEQKEEERGEERGRERGREEDREARGERGREREKRAGHVSRVTGITEDGILL